jgi:allantoin racemase
MHASRTPRENRREESLMPTPNRLLLVNPNTTVEVTRLIESRLRPLLPASVQVTAVTASFGAPYISCEASLAVAGHAVLSAWWQAQVGLSVDAVLIGCFGDPGLFALREVSPVPVTGLAEASFIEAAALGPFAVVTGGERWKPMLHRLALALGLASSLRHIETVVPTGAQLRADPDLAHRHLLQACRASLASAGPEGLKAIVIGGAGLAGWAERLQPEVPVPLIDSVEAGWRVLATGAAPPGCQDAAERTAAVREMLAPIGRG